MITDLQLPSAAQSGDLVDITFTVTNQGTRDTREKAWPDRFFLSRDPSLDRNDTLLLEVSHQGVLAVNGSYTETAQIRLPDGIDGPFYVLAITDSPAYSRTSVASNIGFGNPGVAFEEPYRLPEHDRIWETQRLLARGRVAEYQLEGNNTWVEAIDVTRATPPDLQVTELIAPQRVRMGQDFEITYTVTNLGGDTVPTQPKWDDLIYLSRDEFLDLRADRYLGLNGHTWRARGGQQLHVVQDVSSASGPG